MAGFVDFTGFLVASVLANVLVLPDDLWIYKHKALRNNLFT